MSRMLSHEFWIPGRPQVKQRPRMTRKGHAYTPKATHEAEKYVLSCYDGPRFDGPVELLIDLYPEGTNVMLREVDWTSPLVGDVDNYAKLVADALQLEFGAYENDKSIVSLWVAKHPRGVV